MNASPGGSLPESLICTNSRTREALAPVNAARHQHRGLERQLRRQQRIDLLVGRHASRLVVDDGGAAVGKEIDPVGAPDQRERPRRRRATRSCRSPRRSIAQSPRAVSPGTPGTSAPRARNAAATAPAPREMHRLRQTLPRLLAATGRARLRAAHRDTRSETSPAHYGWRCRVPAVPVRDRADRAASTAARGAHRSRRDRAARFRSRSPRAAAGAARPAAPERDVARGPRPRAVSSARAQASRSLRAASACPSPSPFASCWMRSTQRDATVGAPESFSARVSSTDRAAASVAKSCAARPVRRSGGSRPSFARIGRDSHGSVAASRGQVPSLRPPSTTRSKSSNRASSGPRIASRFWRL